MADWDALDAQQKAGMTREYWEGLKPEEQRALTSTTCIQEGCSKPRWIQAGSFYCEEHAQKASALAYEKAKLEEQD